MTDNDFILIEPDLFYKIKQRYKRNGVSVLRTWAYLRGKFQNRAGIFSNNGKFRLEADSALFLSLSRELQINERTLRSHLDRLIDFGLLRKVGRQYRLVANKDYRRNLGITERKVVRVTLDEVLNKEVFKSLMIVSYDTQQIARRFSYQKKRIQLGNKIESLIKNPNQVSGFNGKRSFSLTTGALSISPNEYSKALKTAEECGWIKVDREIEKTKIPPGEIGKARDFWNYFLFIIDGIVCIKHTNTITVYRGLNNRSRTSSLTHLE